MADEIDEIDKKYMHLWSTIPSSNRLIRALSDWSGLPPSEHKRDAFYIWTAATFQIDNPKEQIERTKRIYKAANDIELAISAMSESEGRALLTEFVDQFRAAAISLIKPSSSSPKSYDDDFLLFFISMRAMQHAAKRSERFAVNLLKMRSPKSKNVNAANLQIAILVSDIYIRVTKREPPKGGATGPFQRLLREVYLALDRPNVDLRGPLRTVHEYRKNRHS